MKEEQLREDQRREALARREEPSSEETLPPPAAVPVEQPVAAPAPAREPIRVEPAPQPKIDPKALLESDGLVMIETDRAKAPAVSAPVEEPQHVGRPRRERPKTQAEDDELKQVETRK